MLTLSSFKFWTRPAILVLVWVIAAAFTLSQLATVAPLLLSTRAEPPPLQRSEQRGRGA